MAKGNILFIDNDANFLHTRSKFLERVGYTVFKAKTLEEALTYLQTSWIHAMIIDVRMVDNNDPDDKSGIDFAGRDGCATIPKIFLTAAPAFLDTRKTLRPIGDRPPIALDYLDKEQSASEMVAVVDDIFADHVNLNEALQIVWRDGSLLTLVERMIPDIQMNYLQDRLGEVEGLFRALFRDRTHVVIEKMIHGESGVQTLVVCASTAEHKQKFVVRCGAHDLIQAEQKKYEQAIEQNRVGRGTEIALSERTPRYAAVAFRFVDFGRNLHMITFGDYVYAADTGHVWAMMQAIFEQLFVWHGVTYTKEANIDALFSIELTTIQDQLQKRIRMVGEDARSVGVCDIELTGDQLSFAPAYRDGFTIPNLMGAAKTAVRASVEKPLRHGVIHGHLSGDTIVLNSKYDVWFIDFSCTEVDAPLLLDSSRFEASLRVEWAQNVDLSACHLLETALRMDDSTLLVGTSYDRYLTNQFMLVQAIRAYAGEVGDPADHLHLLFLTLLEKFLAFESEAHYTVRQIEAFVCLLVAAAHVGMQSETTVELGSAVLSIDQARNEVYVGGQPVPLAPSEYDLLLYLHQYANKVRSRRDIAQDVFDVNIEDEFDEHQIEYNRINTAVNRLRQKIEINPKQPRFLKTIRGKGYRLDVDE